MIWHAYSAYRPKDPDTLRRMNVAAQTWATQMWKELPIPDNPAHLFRDNGGAVPRIRELWDAACKGKPDSDIIVFTNSDICVTQDCSMRIVAALQSINAAYCFRRDFGRLDAPLPAGTIKKGQPYVGSDLYAFRVGWWRKNREHFPDMLLGRECWDAIMRLLIDWTHPGQNPTLYDLIYHEKHASTWENPRNRRSLPSQRHNISLAKGWMLAYGFNPRTIGI